MACREPVVNPRGTPTEPVGIEELIAICARERARSTALFERLGGWVATTEHPPLQRLFAAASHRHAWHAELWAERTPTISVPAPAVDVAAISDADDDTERWTAYVTALGIATTALDALRERVDPQLDPNTIRVVDLVLTDARQLAIDVAAAAPSA
jgi:hypothetical protein